MDVPGHSTAAVRRRAASPGTEVAWADNGEDREGGRVPRERDRHPHDQTTRVQIQEWAVHLRQLPRGLAIRVVSHQPPSPIGD